MIVFNFILKSIIGYDGLNGAAAQITKAKFVLVRINRIILWLLNVFKVVILAVW